MGSFDNGFIRPVFEGSGGAGKKEIIKKVIRGTVIITAGNATFNVAVAGITDYTKTSVRIDWTYNTDSIEQSVQYCRGKLSSNTNLVLTLGAAAATGNTNVSYEIIEYEKSVKVQYILGNGLFSITPVDLKNTFLIFNKSNASGNTSAGGLYRIGGVYMQSASQIGLTDQTGYETWQCFIVSEK